MKRNFLRVALLIATLSLVAGCGSVPQTLQPTTPPSAPEPTTPPPTPEPTAAPTATAITERRPGTLAYAGNGPHAVGMRDITISGGDRTLTATVWLPELNGAPDIAHGPYPLVVYSPGLAGTAKDYDVVLRPMASHGFVVISWNPRGETYTEFWAGAATRPLDTQLIITAAEKLTAPGGQLAGLIDTRRIAVGGHSSGGWTALVGGGAQMDLGWCARYPERVAKLAASNCPQFVPHQQDIAAMLGLKSAPMGPWPPMRDPRVVAVLTASPDGDIWGAEYEGVAVMRVPTLVLAGSNDDLNLPEWCAYPIYEHLGSKQKGLIVFERADHGLGWNTYADAIKHVQAAFLLAQLKGDPVAAAALSPENLAIPGLKYQTTGFGPAN